MPTTPSPESVRSIVVEGGEIVYERYHPLDSPDQATSSFSVAKSFTSAIIGMLIGDGRLELDAPAPVEEWQADGDPRQEITLEDLMRMSSGLEWEEEYSPGGLPLQMLQAPHAADVPISQELVAEPGTVWEYSTGTTAILADIAADELGGGDALDEYVHERLLDPLGMTSTVLLEDSTGTWLGGLGADSTPRDYAKFGLLFLRDGVWDGERILPEGWVDASRSPSSTNPSYGLQWWMSGPPGTFAAEGLFGQRIIVAPELDLVIVMTSTEGGDPFALGNAVYERVRVGRLSGLGGISPVRRRRRVPLRVTSAVDGLPTPRTTDRPPCRAVCTARPTGRSSRRIAGSTRRRSPDVHDRRTRASRGSPWSGSSGSRTCTRTGHRRRARVGPRGTPRSAA